MKQVETLSAVDAAQLDARPLYRQVKASVIARLADGDWAPGTMLPSEPALGTIYGVSPGTVRKALDELTAEHILVRKQGRGTFVAMPDDNRILFHFFRLTSDDGVKRFPESEVLKTSRDLPNATERAALGISGNARVHRIDRIRRLDGVPVIYETISIAAKTSPGFEIIDPIPNNLYALYAAKYGRVITRAEELLKAVSADTVMASALSVPSGTALLRIERTAYALDSAPVEFRVSLCRTEGFRYELSLR